MSKLPLLIFNKPYGVICQFSAHDKYTTLKDYIPLQDCYPAGRLDTDSEGLLILTADGQLQHRISHPKFKKEKTYYLQLEGSPNEEQLAALQQPIDLNDFVTEPAKVRLLTKNEIDMIWPRNPPVRFRKTVPDFWLALTIKEGKNRQVRRMTAKVGYPCLRLIRVQIGKINLFDWKLSVGSYQQIDSISVTTIN